MWPAIFFSKIYAKQTVGTFYHNQKNGHNMRKIGYKIMKKWEKNKNSAHSCHDIAVAVLVVQGQSQNIEKTDKIIKAEWWYISYCSWWDDIW